ncbi:MAG: hypothetical protein FJ267_15100, partial [Planctomycetes bacterium]|nr:hypothetical protein [Planctomycetota bacterium]
MTELLEVSNDTVTLADVRPDEILRTPFYLTDAAGSFFVWRHLFVRSSTNECGVVVCPPIGHEQLHSHRTVRHLCDELARKGTIVLRFDWNGTADSSGDDLDPNRVVAWLTNIQTAVRTLRDEGCQRISLVGIRLGALLAAIQSVSESIDSLVLWAPVVNGRSYVREMNAIDKTSDFQLPADDSTESYIEAAGFRLSPECASELSQYSLLKTQVCCRRVLIAARDDQPEDRSLFDHLSQQGLVVQQNVVPGYA